MIIWLNGTFGVGKTTTSHLLVERLDNTRLFDPEHVGYMLSANFRDIDFEDFQELPPWRELVPLALDTVQRHTGSHIVAPQTVIVEQYWNDLRRHADDLGLELMHVLLDCSERELYSRIAHDETEKQASTWRNEHVPRFMAARNWMLDAADLVVDTTNLTQDEVTHVVADSVRPLIG